MGRDGLGVSRGLLPSQKKMGQAGRRGQGRQKQHRLQLRTGTCKMVAVQQHQMGWGGMKQRREARAFQRQTGRARDVGHGWVGHGHAGMWHISKSDRSGGWRAEGRQSPLLQTSRQAHEWDLEAGTNSTKGGAERVG